MLLARIDDVPSIRPSSQVKEHLRPRTHHQTRHFAGGFRLKDRGFTLLHDARTEPWGQTVARLQSSEGLIIGLSYAPSMHP
jgi:hypothetical protein